ncbi:glutathione peroxidase [Sphingosinithalassobacter sp. LHW66-3]|uniref:glutathione peroxidase n=1 Tax=Sphingosinithalassobacter sp. LHW66-3 TaxID=3424718 RepID=UPI003D6B1194
MAVTDLTVTGADGSPASLSGFAGQVLLIVNTASKCGFTPQYAALEELHRRYQDRGFAVLAFPCNQFGGQEPGSSEDILSFCVGTYGISFPIFGKTAVNGRHQSPLFRGLKEQAPGMLGSRAVKWNFTKFLVDRSGRAVMRFAPATPPSRIAPHIEALL